MQNINKYKIEKNKIVAGNFDRPHFDARFEDCKIIFGTFRLRHIVEQIIDILHTNNVISAQVTNVDCSHFPSYLPFPLKLFKSIDLSTTRAYMYSTAQ